MPIAQSKVRFTFKIQLIFILAISNQKCPKLKTKINYKTELKKNCFIVSKIIITLQVNEQFNFRSKEI